MQLAVWLSFVWMALFASVAHAQVQPPDRARWVALAKGGFVLPADQKAVDVLVEMNPLVASLDPVLRDEVAFSAAERWMVRDRKLSSDEVRRVMKMWLANLDDGLGTTGEDRVFKRSFSALNLSLVAAYDLTAPFMEAAEVQSFFDRMLDYFAREKDLRGFDQTRGWMHTVAHTSDVLKFLARNLKLAAGTDVRLLSAIRTKIDSTRPSSRGARTTEWRWRCSLRFDDLMPMPARSRAGWRSGWRTTRNSGPTGRMSMRRSSRWSRTASSCCVVSTWP